MEWTAQRLSWVALLMGWDEGQNLSVRFSNTCQAAQAQHRHWKLGASYSGFSEALCRQSPQLTPLIKDRLQRHMQQCCAKYWRCNGWLVLAADGTRIEAPHTAANEAGLGCAGRHKTAPQVFLTMLWHAGTGLPWSYRLGPGTDSERNHLAQMVDELPPGSLLLADAGFISYPLCRKLMQRQQGFLLRVGSNITLLTKLGCQIEEDEDRVYLWPLKHRSQPPLALRLIVLREGKTPVYLVTNVLDEKLLPDKQAAELYGLRWGEEVFYRSYKQTLERHTLLSRKSQTCLVEAEWTLLALWLLGLMSVSQIIERGQDPHQWSVAKSRNVVRRALRGAKPRRRQRPNLRRDLGLALKDNYQRHSSKASRNYPRKKREKPPGPPRIQPATPLQIRRAQNLPPPQPPLQWTA